MNIIRFAFSAAIALAAMAVAAGCNGGGGLSLEEYLKRVDELDNQSGERTDALSDRLNLISDESAPDQERIDAAQSAIPEFVSILDDFLSGLKALDPPSDVQQEHEESLAAGEAAAELFDGVATQVGNAESIPELDQALSVLNSDEYTAADQRFTDACLALQAKLEYSNVAYSLLPAEFTLSQLQRAYEAILARPLDKRNFRKRMLSLGIIEATGRTATEGRHRPAQLYAFRERRPVVF